MGNPARYIEKNCDINQEFKFANPEIKTKINHIYNSTFPGSILWDLTSRNIQMLFNSWSVSVRHMWNIPLQTHKYLIEPLAGKHAKVMIYSRYINFIKSIQKRTKIPVKYMYELIYQDTRTITGSNIREILNVNNEENILKINVNHMKNKMKFCKIPIEEEWRVDMIKELTNVKQHNLNIEFENGDLLTNDEIDDLIYFAATS